MAYCVKPKKRGRFLSELRQTGSVTHAAQVIGLTRRRLYYLREEEVGFAEEWQNAWDDYIAKLEAEADRRAVEGYVKQVYLDADGNPHEVRAYSDNLLMFRLKALRPEMYRENVKPEGISPQVLQVLVQKVLVYLSDDQAQELLDFVAAQLTPTGAPRRAGRIQPKTAGPIRHAHLKGRGLSGNEC